MGERRRHGRRPNLAAFGSLWIAQFGILDRILFADHPRAGAPMAVITRPAGHR
jgi:hypothetical protein